MNEKRVKLHLGCGKTHIPGYIHIDEVDFPHIDFKRDISDLSIFGDCSVDLIYACHVLEHFKRKEIDNVLNEWYRVLKVGGMIRLSVPDFEAIITIYKKYEDMELIMGMLYGGQNFETNFHYSAFDFKYLSKKLTNACFKELKGINGNIRFTKTMMIIHNPTYPIWTK